MQRKFSRTNQSLYRITVDGLELYIASFLNYENFMEEINEAKKQFIKSGRMTLTEAISQRFPSVWENNDLQLIDIDVTKPFTVVFYFDTDLQKSLEMMLEHISDYREYGIKIIGTLTNTGDEVDTFGKTQIRVEFNANEDFTLILPDFMEGLNCINHLIED